MGRFPITPKKCLTHFYQQLKELSKQQAALLLF